MQKLNPIVGVILLVLCIVAAFVFGKYHVDPGQWISMAGGVALAIVYGTAHADANAKLETSQTELTTLRARVRMSEVERNDTPVDPENPRSVIPSS